jgi:hypothetical protein
VTSIVFQLFSKIEYSGVDLALQYERVPVGCKCVILELVGVLKGMQKI